MRIMTLLKRKDVTHRSHQAHKSVFYIAIVVLRGGHYSSHAPVPVTAQKLSSNGNETLILHSPVSFCLKGTGNQL